jgi:hypothetical protein
MALVTLTSSNGVLISICKLISLFSKMSFLTRVEAHEIATRSQLLQNVIKDFEHIQDKDINIPIPEVGET